MMHSHARLLAAKGLALGKVLPIKGLRVFLAKDQAGKSLLVLRGKVFGPSWPSIAVHLEHSNIEYSIIEGGRIWIVTFDHSTNRAAIQASMTQARKSIRDQVLVPDVGFVNAGIKKSFEPRILIGPVVVAVVSLSLALVPELLPKPNDQAELVTPEVSCALDLANQQLEDWITSSIGSSSSTASGEILVQSKLGLLSIKVLQTIGSTQSVTGSIRCDDGRSKNLHYRLDASANGNLVQLSQKLDP
jgi:hypothetical protein